MEAGVRVFIERLFGSFWLFSTIVPVENAAFSQERGGGRLPDGIARSVNIFAENLDDFQFIFDI